MDVMRFRRHLLAALVLSASCSVFTPPAAAPEWSIADAVGHTEPVTVTCGPMGYSGTAVGIGSGLAVTAAHVVVRGCSASVRGAPAEVLWRDDRADVALIRVPRWRPSAVEVSASVRLGESVTCVNYSYQPAAGRPWLQVTRGHVVAKYPDRVRVSCSFGPGGSGGGVWDERGRLVGLSRGLYEISRHYLIVPGREVKRAIGRVGAQN